MKRHRAHSAVRWFLAGVFTLAFTACGGGGGGNGDSGGVANSSLGTGVAVSIAGGTLSFQDDEGDQ